MGFLNRAADRELHKWQLRADGGEISPRAAAARRLAEQEERRLEEIERSHQFAEPYLREDGTRGNMADLIPAIYELNRQMELQFPSMTKRSLVRLELAHAIETRVLPLTDDEWFHKLPGRLRDARQDFCLGFRPSDGNRRVMWDNKAGLSRICPDDAREDARRLNRRVIEPLLAMKKDGCQVTYAVFTVPNYAAGDLRKGIKEIYRMFGARILRRRHRGKLAFANLEAAMCVLEAPLSAHRDWNVHLNVLLVHRGFLDWRAMQEAWHWGVKFQRIKGGREELEAALREIIKYSARAVAEKSELKPGHEMAEPLPGFQSEPNSSTPGVVDAEPGAAPSAAPGNAGPPAMCDWTGEELLEWLSAFRGFRRTRTYRALYRLEKPARDDLAGYVWIGKGEWVRTGWRLTLGPLFSIPGDKSTTPDPLERWWKLRRALKPPPRPPDKCERFA